MLPVTVGIIESLVFRRAGNATRLTEKTHN